MNVPIANPGAAYRRQKADIDKAVGIVLDGGWYVLGKAVDRFELAFADWCGCRYAVGVANGTDAVELALRAIGVASGDAVATVANTANATVSAIERIGAKPVFVDVCEDTFTMDVSHLANALSSQKIRAVVPVHLYGHPADMERIVSVAKSRGAGVVEDCAQAHGASIKGRKVGTFGDAAAFSFYPTKNLGALGDGGAVVTNDDSVFERLRLLRQYGWRTRYESEIKGVNSRLDEIQAAILSVKLGSLNEMNARRREIAARYSSAFGGLPFVAPVTMDGCEHVFHQYTIRCHGRDDLARLLKGHGVGTGILYPVPIHLQKAYLHEQMDARLPVTERLAKEILSLPVYPELSNAEVDYVIATVKDCAVKQ